MTLPIPSYAYMSSFPTISLAHALTLFILPVHSKAFSAFSCSVMPCACYAVGGVAFPMFSVPLVNFLLSWIAQSAHHSAFSSHWLHAVLPVPMPATLFLNFCLRHFCFQSFLIPRSFYAVLIVSENKEGS